MKQVYLFLAIILVFSTLFLVSCSHSTTTSSSSSFREVPLVDDVPSNAGKVSLTLVDDNTSNVTVMNTTNTSTN